MHDVLRYHVPMSSSFKVPHHGDIYDEVIYVGEVSGCRQLVGTGLMDNVCKMLSDWRVPSLDIDKLRRLSDTYRLDPYEIPGHILHWIKRQGYRLHDLAAPGSDGYRAQWERWPAVFKHEPMTAIRVNSELNYIKASTMREDTTPKYDQYVSRIKGGDELGVGKRYRLEVVGGKNPPDIAKAGTEVIALGDSFGDYTGWVRLVDGSERTFETDANDLYI